MILVVWGIALTAFRTVRRNPASSVALRAVTSVLAGVASGVASVVPLAVVVVVNSMSQMFVRAFHTFVFLGPPY